MARNPSATTAVKHFPGKEKHLCIGILSVHIPELIGNKKLEGGPNGFSAN